MKSLLGFISPYIGAIKIGLLAGAIIAAALGGWTTRGWLADRDISAIREDIAEQREKAISEARAEERKQQEKVNEALRKQNTALEGINTRLHRDIDRLRNRPERSTGMSETPRASCAGATGTELSRSDAEFLVREAARADQIRAGLIGCYEAFDALR